MPLAPSRVVNITAAGTAIVDHMVALYADISANSDWSLPLQEQTTNQSLTGIVLADDGEGGTYAVDDILTVSGGVFTTAATIRVTSVFTGFISTISIENPGDYSVIPGTLLSNPVTGGGGTGGDVDLTFSALSPGMGSFSFVMRSPDGIREIAVINSGSQGTPSVLTARIGVNPSALSNPITDSAAPWAGTTDFSGSSLATMVRSWRLTGSEHPQFLWWEWPDAVLYLAKNGARTYTPRGWHAGNVWVPPLTHLTDVGNVHFDGNGIMGYIPRGDSNFNFGSVTNIYWLDEVQSTRTEGFSAVRIGAGQSLAGTGNTDGNRLNLGWRTNTATAGSGTSDASSIHYFGPDSEYHPYLFSRAFSWYWSVFSRHYPRVRWVFGTQYCLLVEPTSPFSIVNIGGNSVALTISDNTSSRRLALPVPNGFIINP